VSKANFNLNFFKFKFILRLFKELCLDRHLKTLFMRKFLFQDRLIDDIPMFRCRGERKLMDKCQV